MKQQDEKGLSHRGLLCCRRRFFNVLMPCRSRQDVKEARDAELSLLKQTSLFILPLAARQVYLITT